MPNGLKPLPEPLKVVDAIGDVILQIPALPAKIAQQVGSAVQGFGSEQLAAVKSTTDVGGDALPDPVTFVAGALDYVIAIPKGAVAVVKGMVEGVGDTLGSAQGRLRRLVK